MNFPNFYDKTFTHEFRQAKRVSRMILLEAENKKLGIQIISISHKIAPLHVMRNVCIYRGAAKTYDAEDNRTS